ncbi:FecR family protein [Paraflavitalea sp. CAU 1676]|uniref:FecR family protein n=1 Tax=Paraflavitalea sp. CAU 1676 TaxID=3032598 RepID=UPI0023DCE167|nr:FecR family protein [Paraflavitalea sp. CAU 1676]MDF2187791.1 FecR domain-containing protein [Paraflavitalea sp. CAU 1676]
MAANDDRLVFLLQQFAGNRCSRDELNELFQKLEHTDNESLYAFMDAFYDQLPASAKADQVDWDHMFSQIMAKRAVVKKFNRAWLAAAAALVLLVGAGILYFTLNRSSNNVQSSVSSAEMFKPPASARAVITLGDGRVIGIDSASNGMLAKVGNIQIVKLADGQVAYSGEGSAVMFNTLSNPRGSKVVTLALADGTRVWLNAASSIRFPTQFIGNRRDVQVTGEAYFEVAHDAAKPFHVLVNNIAVQVIGTHFNIMAFEDENAIRTTLLEGAVRVSKGNAFKRLYPGQQAVVASDGNIQVLPSVDLDGVMAWKNGFIQLDGTDIKTVMRGVARWYAIDVRYEGNFDNVHLSGQIPRTLTLSTLTTILQKSGIDIVFSENTMTLSSKP